MNKKTLMGLTLSAILVLGGGVVLTTNVARNSVLADGTTTVMTNEVEALKGDTMLGDTGVNIKLNFTDKTFEMTEGSIQKIKSFTVNASDFSYEAGYRYDGDMNHIAYVAKKDSTADTVTFEAGLEPSRIKLTAGATNLTDITINYVCDNAQDSYNRNPEFHEVGTFVVVNGVETKAKFQHNQDEVNDLELNGGETIAVVKYAEDNTKTDVKFNDEVIAKLDDVCSFNTEKTVATAKVDGLFNLYITGVTWINAKHTKQVDIRGQMNGWNYNDEWNFTKVGTDTYELTHEVTKGTEFKVVQEIRSTDHEKGHDTYWHGKNIFTGDAAGNFGEQNGNVLCNETATYKFVFNWKTYKVNVSIVK